MVLRIYRAVLLCLPAFYLFFPFLALSAEDKPWDTVLERYRACLEAQQGGKQLAACPLSNGEKVDFNSTDPNKTKLAVPSELHRTKVRCGDAVKEGPTLTAEIIQACLSDPPGWYLENKDGTKADPMTMCRETIARVEADLSDGLCDGKSADGAEVLFLGLRPDGRPFYRTFPETEIRARVSTALLDPSVVPEDAVGPNFSTHAGSFFDVWRRLNSAIYGAKCGIELCYGDDWKGSCDLIPEVLNYAIAALALEDLHDPEFIRKNQQLVTLFRAQIQIALKYYNRCIEMDPNAWTNSSLYFLFDSAEGKPYREYLCVLYGKNYLHTALGITKDCGEPGVATPEPEPNVTQTPKPAGDDGKKEPLCEVVYVGAPWCPFCPAVKKEAQRLATEVFKLPIDIIYQENPLAHERYPSLGLKPRQSIPVVILFKTGPDGKQVKVYQSVGGVGDLAKEIKKHCLEEKESNCEGPEETDDMTLCETPTEEPTSEPSGSPSDSPSTMTTQVPLTESIMYAE